MQAANLGLEIDGVLGHAYLVKYGNECKLVPGYLGKLYLCRMSGEIHDVMLEAVFVGDQFSYQLGDDARIEHIPGDQTPKTYQNLTHVYGIATLRGGGKQRAVMTIQDIDEHRRSYVRANEGPWNHPLSAVQMAKKTVLLRLMKLLPLTVEARRVVQDEEYYIAGVDIPQPARGVAALEASIRESGEDPVGAVVED